MSLKSRDEEFHVALWRVGREKFGLKLAVFRDTMKILAITGGTLVDEMNRRCRTCRVREILDQQLLVHDQVVSVNGETEVPRMLQELNNFIVECCHLRVRRCSQQMRVVPVAGCFSGVRVVESYDPPMEPEEGYLGVIEGAVVTVQLGSRAAPEARNRFQCDYVFAWKTGRRESRGWLPVDILEERGSTVY